MAEHGAGVPPDTDARQPLQEAYLENPSSPVLLWSEAASVAFTCDSETLTCTTGSPTQVGASPSGGGGGGGASEQYNLAIRRNPLGEVVSLLTMPIAASSLQVGVEVTAADGDALLLITGRGPAGLSWPVLSGSSLDIYRVVDAAGAVIDSPVYAECDFHQEGDDLIIDASPTSDDFTVEASGFFLQVNIVNGGRYLFAGSLVQTAD